MSDRQYVQAAQCPNYTDREIGWHALLGAQHYLEDDASTANRQESIVNRQELTAWMLIPAQPSARN